MTQEAKVPLVAYSARLLNFKLCLYMPKASDIRYSGCALRSELVLDIYAHNLKPKKLVNKYTSDIYLIRV